MVVRALPDADLEVTYTGIRQPPEAIADAAERFGAEVVGVSILSGAHMDLIPRVLDAMQRRGMEDTPLIAGGIIPQADRLALLEMGVAAIFGPGARTADIVEATRRLAADRRRQEAGRR